LSIELPGGYEKETWAMDIDEKLNALPKMRADGNKLFAEKDYLQAGEKYCHAVGLLEQLALRYQRLGRGGGSCNEIYRSN